MLSALGKLIKFIIILIAIIVGIAFFTGTEVSFLDNETSSSTPASESTEVCKVGYYKNSSKSDCLKVPDNAFSASENWYCKSGYIKSGEGCIKKANKQVKKTSSNSDTSKVKSSSKPDRWWEKTDKYAICYGRVTQAHKDNGLHDRNRDMSVKMKKEICKIAATSTTGEGSFWIE
ncbi:hypothetical protein N8269_04975 [Candidatus Thioglobus sp.]|nr:hypothetical protein [Candidatus Thioglobus sp.]